MIFCNTGYSERTRKMSLKVGNPSVGVAELKSAKKEVKQAENKETKPQSKEHCTSKASKALRGVALGLMMAAGVASMGKTAKVNAQAMPAATNQPTVTQEAETNAPKTDVEMAIDDLMENEGKTITFKVGPKSICIGEMRGGEIFENGRNYDCAKISNGGALVFYETKTVTTPSGSKSTEYIPVNSFDLQATPDGKSIDLKSGSRFEESVKMNGDYVELAEDGTFNVYNSEGEKIGHVKCDTPSSYKAKLAFIAGGLVAAGAYEAIKKKEEE